MVTDDSTTPDREGEGGVTEGSSLWKAGPTITAGGQIEVATFTGHRRITGVSAGPVRDNRQDRILHWI